MATYLFSQLPKQATLNFDPALDTLSFDSAGMSAAAGTITQDGADLLLHYQHKTIRLAGFSLAQLSSSHFVFAGGSKLLVGDDSPATLEDDLANTLNGTGRDDYLNGLGGADRLNGRKGNDALFGNAGNDHLHAGVGDDVLMGGDGNDILYGEAGNDRLDGGIGKDIMSGGYGNDTFVVNHVGDIVIETNRSAGEIDTVRSWLWNYTLPANVENLQLMGTLAYNGVGNLHANRLLGNPGNNVLDGQGGADVLRGGNGNDSLRVNDVNFADLDGGNGIDTLVLAGKGLHLDLTLLGSKLHNLEAIDLGGNRLSLTAATVESLSSTSDVLVVDGNAQAVVDPGEGWTQGEDTTANGRTYHTYTQEAATLWLNAEVSLYVNDFLSLANLDDSNGFRLDGAAAGDAAGVSVSEAGDVNGDGFGDLIVGAQGSDPNGKQDAGSSYVVFGQATGFAATLQLSALDAGNGFRLDGVDAGDFSGRSVSAAGDVNGDGFGDILLGTRWPAPSGNGVVGSSYVVFGQGSGFPATLELSDLDGSNGFRLDGAPDWDWSGHSLSAAGDVNGDGFGDLIVGVQGADPNGRPDAGFSYVVFGQASGFGATLDLATLDGSNGFRLDGAARWDESGGSVSAAGDVNGDGFGDLIIGAPYVGSYHGIYYYYLGQGSSYVVFGHASGFDATLNLATLDGSNGFRLDGAEQWDESGGSVSAAGDVNGDGFGDLIVGATEQSYVVFGQASGFPATLELSSLDGGNGFRLDGAGWGNRSVRSVSAAGDVNGDGFGDLIVGIRVDWPGLSGRTGAGYSYLVFGRSSGFTPALELSALDGSNGFRLDGVAAYDGWGYGYSVSGAGDVNGDGFADLIVGAQGADPSGQENAGSSHVVFGGNSTHSVTHLGTAANDSIAGTYAAERFVSAQGNDSLSGGGGVDGFESGQGDDLIQVPDLAWQRVDAGSGIDALALTGAGLHLDLADFRNQIFGIERIDLTGSGDNTLTLLTRDLLNLSETSNTLLVDGNAGDRCILQLLQNEVWTPGADLTLAGITYHTYDNGAARLWLNPLLTLDPASPVNDAPLANHDTQSVHGDSPAGGNVLANDSDVDGDLLAVTRFSLDSNGDGYLEAFHPGDTATIPWVGSLILNGDGSYAFTLAPDYWGPIPVVTYAIADGHGGGDTATLALGPVIPARGVLPLASLDGSNGFRLDGVGWWGQCGFSVSSAGDVNADGFDDLIVGAPKAGGDVFDDGTPFTGGGASYVVFGQAMGFAATFDLADLDGVNGFRLDGVGWWGQYGFSVSSAGDVNGDGFDDLIVGSPETEEGVIDGGTTGAGVSYVVFGQATGFAATLKLADLDGFNGFRLDGVALEDGTGSSVSAAGDINGDGYGDLIVGASGADLNSQRTVGSSYVLFGRAAGFSATLNLADLDGINGFRLDGGAAEDGAGSSVSAAGDVNGDGFDDLIVGASGADPHGQSGAGSSYVVFGKASGFAATLDLANLDGFNGFRLDGVAVEDGTGSSVSAAGDVNGDGVGDLIIGARGGDPNGQAGAGSSYVVFGQAAGFAATLDLSSLDGRNGFRLDGVTAEDGSGVSVSAAGDVNGDGFGDLIVGAEEADPNGKSDAGSSYVVFGQAAGFAATLELSSLDGSNGFRLNGVAGGDGSGSSVSAAGDVNGDGFGDLIVGAPEAAHVVDSVWMVEAGSAYVVFGGNFTHAVTHLGTAADDSFTGTAAAERFVAAQGNDSLTGGGGADVFAGGEGDDRMQIPDLAFQRIDGGSGIDTLALGGAGLHLNLADFRNQIFSIEQIDLTGSGNNTLSFLTRDLLNLSDTSNTLQVDGDAGDRYDLQDGDWVQGADVILLGVAYHSYDSGAAHLLLNAALTAA